MPRIPVARAPVARAILALALLALATLAPAPGVPAGASDIFDDSVAAQAFATLRAGIVARVAAPYQPALLVKADRAAALAVGTAPNVCAAVGVLGALDRQVTGLAVAASIDTDTAAALLPPNPVEPQDRCLPPNPIITD